MNNNDDETDFPEAAEAIVSGPKTKFVKQTTSLEIYLWRESRLTKTLAWPVRSKKSKQKT